MLESTLDDSGSLFLILGFKGWGFMLVLLRVPGGCKGLGV